MADLPNKVTKEDLEHLVARSTITYTNLAGTLTHCMVTLPCGFQVTGESACVDPANYNKELGEEIALKKVITQLWPLEGYLLANDIYRVKQPTSYASRMIFEQSDLREKLDKLCDFLSKPQPSFIDDKEWELLLDQRDYMSEYFNILEIRIKIALSKKLESDAVKKTALAFSEKVTAEVNKCTAPQDPDHELTEDEIKRLNETGSLCDCAKDIVITGETSDGYHTFDELYYHRMVLFSIICNNNKEVAFKSKLHADGTMFDDYFIVGVKTPNGYYTYHYHLDDWNMFDVNEVDRAPEWDGHKPSDIRRLLTL